MTHPAADGRVAYLTGGTLRVRRAAAGAARASAVRQEARGSVAAATRVVMAHARSAETCVAGTLAGVVGGAVRGRRASTARPLEASRGLIEAVARLPALHTIVRGQVAERREQPAAAVVDAVDALMRRWITDLRGRRASGPTVPTADRTVEDRSVRAGVGGVPGVCGVPGRRAVGGRAAVQAGGRGTSTGVPRTVAPREEEEEHRERERANRGAQDNHAMCRTSKNDAPLTFRAAAAVAM